MNPKSKSFSRLFILTVLLVVIAASALRFEEQRHPVNDSHLDPIALLAPPPLPGSAEQAADLAEVTAVHNARTLTEEKMAWLEAPGVSLSPFTNVIGPFFQPDKLPKTSAFFNLVLQRCENILNIAKNHWERPRPFVVDPRLADGPPAGGFSYPSGHSTDGTVYALLLSEIFPDKRDAILAVGRDIGWHRVILAKHYPTDVMAGRVLAQAIVRELKADPHFQHDFAQVKAEIAAAQETTKN
jgi:acid phosphatase (class A)